MHLTYFDKLGLSFVDTQAFQYLGDVVIYFN
jgi:hypothetical protein